MNGKCRSVEVIKNAEVNSFNCKNKNRMPIKIVCEIPSKVLDLVFVHGFYTFLMRIELALPGYVLSEFTLHSVNVLFTAHGILMIFFFIMPILIGGLGNIIVPIQLAAIDMVFPRLNNLSF